MLDNLNIEEMKRLLRDFAKKRDWERFHNPKNLAMALTVESAELLEIFQWLTEQEAYAIKEEEGGQQAVAHELADILLYAIRLADQLEINLSEAIRSKLIVNGEKYPVG